MSANPKDNDAITAYLRLLGNPYAKLQVIGGGDDDHEVQVDLEPRPPTDQERAYAVRQGNQYTLLSVALGNSAATAADAAPPAAVPVKRRARPSLSKADYAAGCTRILRSYIPSVERGRLRQHHRDFILRTQNRSGTTRHLLLQELAKYDLGAASGIEARFNRERDDLTDEKLKQIEKSVLEKEYE